MTRIKYYVMIEISTDPTKTMLRFTINVIEVTRQISVTNKNREETIELGIVSNLSMRDYSPMASAICRMPDQEFKATVTNFSSEAVEYLEKLQFAFPNILTVQNQGTSLDFSVVMSGRTGFELNYKSR